MRRSYIPAFCALSMTVYLVATWIAPALPRAVDWETVFYPATRAVWATGSPYVQGFLNPPWAILPLLGCGLAPAPVGRALLFLMSLAAFAYLAIRLGGTPVTTGLFLLSPPVMHCLLNGNIDWLVLLGLLVPPQWGLFLVILKPQMGLGVAIYWAWDAWRQGRWKQLYHTLAPVGLALSMSFVVYGPWPLTLIGQPDKPWNASLWPLLIPVGLVLLVRALRSEGDTGRDYALAAGPCLAPYIMFHSYVGLLVPLLRKPIEMAIAVGGLWVAVLITGGLM